MKQCKRCGEMKPPDQFNSCKGSKDKLRYICKPCHNIEVRDRYKAAHPPKTPATKLEKFTAQYVPVTESGCWLWLGHLRNGYGAMKDEGKYRPAHRVSWELHFGEIPNGMHVLHKCDVPACVNPQHLFLGTHQDNMDDKVRKGRQAKGAKITGLEKLNTQEVIEIRELSKTERTKDLAAKYGVCINTIQCIKYGRTWRHIMSG